VPVYEQTAARKPRVRLAEWSGPLQALEGGGLGGFERMRVRMRLLDWWSGSRREATRAVAEARAFRRQISRELARALRLGQPFAVIALEQRGSSAGAALGRLATALRGRMRATDAVGWLGAHELGLLLRYTSSVDALALAQEIRQEFDEPAGPQVRCTVFCHPPPALQNETKSEAARVEPAAEQCAS